MIKTDAMGWEEHRIISWHWPGLQVSLFDIQCSHSQKCLCSLKLDSKAIGGANADICLPIIPLCRVKKCDADMQIDSNIFT